MTFNFSPVRKDNINHVAQYMKPKQLIEDLEDGVVEVVKAPFKIVNKLFDDLFDL